MPYLWKKLSGGGNLAHFEMKWCPNKRHDGGDQGKHVRGIDEFGADVTREDGLRVHCIECTNADQRERNAEQREAKKQKVAQNIPLS